MDWNIHLVQSSSIFAPLRVHSGAVFDKNRPDFEDFQRLLDAREPPVTAGGGERLRIVPQGRKPLELEDRYEARIYLRGELQMRPGSLHDAFNLLVWLAFPRAKAALNVRHFAALKAQHAAGAANRGSAQDALTLLDESGVIVISSDPDLLRMLQEWRWKDLFWESRARLAASMRFLLLGHAVYERALRPFMGMVGRGILLEAEPALIAAPPREQLSEIDARVAERISDPGRMLTTRELDVVPVLGVPGWHAGNGEESFYENTDYFRSARRTEKRDS
jgi:hypothetical protein